MIKIIESINVEYKSKDNNAYQEDVIYVPLSPFEISDLIVACDKQEKGCKCHKSENRWIEYSYYLKEILKYWRKRHDEKK
ncbi:MAG: hypothetical protein PHP92_04015 [Candidatus Nanoarchaeia archaeon]|nr:hypothetical protein [Candidatus Nanoarchaeia archaeon]